jgi:hypothetical protein
VVSGYQETRDEIQKLIDDVLPTLQVNTVTTLGTKGKCKMLKSNVASRPFGILNGACFTSISLWFRPQTGSLAS